MPELSLDPSLARSAQALATQLQAPAEPLMWWPAGAGPHTHVQALFEDRSHALVLPVALGIANTPTSPAASTSASILATGTVALVKLSPPSARQRLALPEEAPGATHLLVMGWALRDPLDRTWEKFRPHTLWTEDDHPALDTRVLQAALDLLRTTRPNDFDRNLLPLPTPGTSSKRLPDRTWLATTPQAVGHKGSTRFVFASCLYPRGLLDRLPAGAALQRLEQVVRTAPLDAVLLLGDQIYADATYGLLDPTSADDRYARNYLDLRTQIKTYPGLSHLLRHGRWNSTPDDHELRDNWEPGAVADDAAAVALDAFDNYRLGSQPPRQPSGGFWGVVPLGGGHEVFMLDTRSERGHRPWPSSNPPTASIMSTAQEEALKHWLSTTRSPVRWVSSGVWLLPRQVGKPKAQGHTQAMAPALCDDWSGYPTSLNGLLGWITHQGLQNIVVLCGDAHLAGHTVLTLWATGRPTATSSAPAVDPVRVDLLHCPALYAPFPFANAQPHHFLQEDVLEGAWGGQAWRGEVHSTLWHQGDGFVVVEAGDDPTAPHITATFNTVPPHTVHITSATDPEAPQVPRT